MPYRIVDTGKPGDKRYEIRKATTGEVVAHSDSKRNARLYCAHAEGSDNDKPQDKTAKKG